MKRIASSLVLVAALAARAHADDVDVRRFEYLDVLETSDGSIWKGVVVEQTPNVAYKIATADGSLHVVKAEDIVKLTKQRNPQYRVASTARVENGEYIDGGTGPALPAPFARSGARLDAELAMIVPTGMVGKVFETSFAPTVRVGYEALFGNIGLSAGGQARFTYWRLPGDTSDASWTLETHLYGRGALHLGRVAPYVGLALGLDTNYIYANNLQMSQTELGLGMNLDFGLAIAATPAIAIDVGGDYHPGTDSLAAGQDFSVEYFAFRVGSEFRF